MRSYNWGILGPGSIANNFSRGLKEAEHAVLYAVGSRDEGRAQAFAQKYGYEKAYGSYEDLAKDPDIDIIYVATPHPQHEEAVLLCLNSKKAVLCEKPFAVNARQARRMVDCARKNGVFLMEGMWTRFLPTLRRVKEIIDQGLIGELRYVTADFGFRANVDPESRLFAPSYAGGSLLDVGVYNISLATFLFGEFPTDASSHMKMGETGVDEEAAVMLTYSGGRSAHLYSAIRANTPQQATIIGDRGRITLPGYWHGSSIHLVSDKGAEDIDLPFEASGFQYEATEAMDCLKRGLKESPIMPLDETIKIIELLDGIRKDNGLTYPCDEA